VRAFAVDVVAIVLFAVLGRRNHDEGSTIGGVLVVAWPFVAGWTIAFFATRLDRRPGAAGAALRALVIAVPVALVLRGVAGRGIAPAFIVVAVVFLGVVLVGRRALVSLVAGQRRRRAARASTG
jgi:Protein of unknown function (DUF3054)